MVAYVVFTRENTRDPAQLDLYRQKAPAGFAGHAVRFLSRHGRLEVLEGSKAEDVMMLEFPSFDAAIAWYRNPVYQAACVHRFAGADYRCLVIEGG